MNCCKDRWLKGGVEGLTIMGFLDLESTRPQQDVSLEKLSCSS